MPTNVFPPRLREIAELDEYLTRLQRSMKHKINGWSGQHFDDAIYVTSTIRNRIIEIRAALRKEAEALVVDIPIVTSARGTSVWFPHLLRVLVLVDIEKAHSPAALWRFCGLGLYNFKRGVIPDTVATFTAPGRVTFSTKAKREMHYISLELIKRRSPYRAVYDQQRAMWAGRGHSTGGAHRRAKRYVSKLWLKHLWLVWRRQEKLPVGPGHPDDVTNLAAPFGWL